MKSRTENYLNIALMAASALLAVLVIFLLAMTQPRWATPVANWALGSWAPEGSSVEQAHLRFPAITTVAATGVNVPDTVTAQDFEARVNIFGFLPFVSWVSRLEAEQGSIRLGGKPDDSGEDEDDTDLADYRAIVDEIALSGIELRLTREDGDRIVMVEQAEGSLRSGAVVVSATGAGTRLEFDGEATSRFSGLQGGLRVTGDNFANLADLAGLAAPDTPPFNVVMDVDIEDGLWRFNFRPETRIGDSDISGPLTVTLGGETPVVDAELVSQTLDADDLGIVFGIPIGVGENETSGAEQTRAREIYNESDRLIPSVVIDFARLDTVDGRVSYRAETVSDAVFDITGLELDFEIEGRVVRAPLLQATFEQGSLDAYATIDGTRSPAVTTAEGNLRDVALANLALDPFLRGTAEGRFKLEATGDGFREAADTMDGEFAIWSTSADILALAVEGAALDIGEALTVLGEDADDRTYAETRCLVAVATLVDGTATLDPAVVDTDDSVVIVKGDIDLGTERMKLSIRSDAKDASLGTLVGDVGIGGTLRNPSLLPFSAETVAQVGIATLLGSLSGGLAALPFIEPGMAEDAPCGSLLARAEATAG